MTPRTVHPPTRSDDVPPLLLSPLSFFTRLALRSPLLGVPFECGPIHLDGRLRRRSSRELEERFGRTLSPELFQHLQHLLVALLGGCRGEGVGVVLKFVVWVCGLETAFVLFVSQQSWFMLLLVQRRLCYTSIMLPLDTGVLPELVAMVTSAPRLTSSRMHSG